MPPTAPAPGKAPPGATGAALAGARDAASRLPAIRRSGGHRRQRWRHRARRRLRTARPGQHRAAGAVAPGRRLRAAADVTGAAVLLAGLPWGLGGLAGPPLPGHWPGWQQVREFLASPLSGGTAIRVLAGAAWLLWAVFAVAVIAEVTAAACGRPVPRLPAIAPVQALAATLAGTVVITALHLPRTAARAAQPPHAVLTATVTTAGPLLPGGAAGGGLPGIAGRFPGNAGDRPRISWLDAARAAGTSGPARPDDRVHTVVAGDNLWDLARTYLGSGERWHQIYDLNRGRPQPGGGTLTDPARIYHKPSKWPLTVNRPQKCPARNSTRERCGSSRHLPLIVSPGRRLVMLIAVSLVAVVIRPCGPARRGLVGRCGNHAELLHLREDVDHPPGLSDSAAREAEDEDLVVGDGLAGWPVAHVVTLVGPSNRVAADDLVPLRDQILDRDMEVGENPKESGEHLLQHLRPGRVDRQRRADQGVRLEELVDRPRDEPQIAGVGRLMEASDRRFVGLVVRWHFAFSLARGSTWAWLVTSAPSYGSIC